MKCTVCGTPMKTQRENYRYDECGLKKITLVGIEVKRCPQCGNYEISIPRIEELHRLIAGVVELSQIRPRKATAARLKLWTRDDQWEILSA